MDPKKDLRIRELSRPKVSKDSKAGYHSIQRKFVIEGDKASKVGILGQEDGFPLFLEVGTEDEEFSGYYLVDQALEGSPGTMDKANLTRTYVEIRDTWNSETVTESTSLKKVTRSYVVLRSSHSRGYTPENFAKHPTQTSDNYDAWEYIPIVVQATKPQQKNYSEYVNSASSSPGSLSPPSLGTTPLYNAISNSGGVFKYLESSVKVDHTSPGIDLWSVSWVCPVDAFWSTATTSKSVRSIDLPAVVDFDERGMEVFDMGSSGGGNVAAQAWQYNFFTVGDSVPAEMINYMGGTGSTTTPCINLDFHFMGYEGTSRSHSFKQLMRNAVWRKSTRGTITFPTSTGARVVVATKRSFGYDFNYSCGSDAPALFQGMPISRAGGRIDYSSQLADSGSNSSRIATQIAPVASHKGERIWKISITFVS